jgi:hypothetical protein
LRLVSKSDAVKTRVQWERRGVVEPVIYSGWC